VRNAEPQDNEEIRGLLSPANLTLMGETVAPNNLVELVQWHLERHKRRRIFLFLADGEREAGQLDFATLDRKARAIAGELQARGMQGARALLMFQSGLDFVTAFYGCLYAGVCAVPVYPPQNRSSYLRRLERIASDCDAKIILGTTSYLAKVGKKLECFETLGRASTLAVDSIDCRFSNFKMPCLASTSTAFLQYTSGSTSAPKGVIVSHNNLLHNIASMQQRFSLDHNDVIVSWLPLFHDMGLIGAVLQTISLGANCVVMSPAAFLQKPVRWLRAIAKYRGTTTFAPNFAYELCSARIKRSDIECLDLSSWTMALNGAEPIKPTTLEAFKDAFAVAGVPENTVYPGYGLAEATLYVSGSQRLSPVKYLDVDTDAYEREGRVLQASAIGRVRRLASSGMPNPDLDVVIVGLEKHERCDDGAVGEVWVHGESVALGYWGKQQETDEQFGAQIRNEPGKTYLRTGDLGFLWEDHLFISGRIKDVLVVRGANHYPQDIEDLIHTRVAELRAGGGAAFTVDIDGENKLVLVHEVERAQLKKIDGAAVFRQATRLISEEFGLSLHCIALIQPSTLPKTSSGKIQRSSARAQFMASELSLIALESAHAAGASALGEIDTRSWSAASTSDSAEIADLVAVLALIVSQRTGLPLKEIDPHQAVVGFGLDSLALADMTETIMTMCGVRIPLGRLLEAQALADIAQLIRALREKSHEDSSAVLVEEKVMPPSMGGATFPLSLNQTQMLLSYKKSPDSAACNVPFCIAGSFDLTRFRQALRRVVETYPILAARLEFDSATQQWLQVIGFLPEQLLIETDVSYLDERQVHRLLVDTSRIPFDVEQGNTFRFELFSMHPDRQWLLLNFHHIIVDLISVDIFVSELLRCYNDPESTSPSVERKSYREFVQWQQAFIESDAGKAAVRYWRDRLRSGQPALRWPSQIVSLKHGETGSSLEFDSVELTSERLQRCATRFGVTVNVILLAAYQLFLAKLCSQRSFNIGVTHVGRPDSSFRNTLGYFVEPAVFVADISLHEPLDTLVKDTQKQLIDIIDHAGAALHVLLERGNQSSAEAPTYQTLFTYYPHRLDAVTPFNANMVSTPIPGAPQLSYVPLASPGAQLDLSLLAAGDGTGMQFRFEFDNRLFDSQQVGVFADYYLHVLEMLLDSSCGTTGDISLISNADKTEASKPLESMAIDFGESRPIHVLIEENVRLHPERVAVRFEGRSLTYAELNRAADELVAHIVELVPPQTAIGVFADRSFDMVTALLAVLKAGCAYVPIDPSLPPDRVAKVADLAELQMILVGSAKSTKKRFDILANSLDNIPEAIVVGCEKYPASCEAAVAHEVHGDDLAYVIFTSGSTGEPKGVMNTHAALLNRLLWMKSAYGIDQSDRILQKTPFTFDVSVWEFFLPLLSSATLVLAKPGGHKDSAYLTDLIDREDITVLHFVPSMLDAFLANPGSRLDAVNHVFCSGEELPADLQRRFFARFSPCQLHNLYGPTEAAIDVSFWRCIDDDDATRVPIGSPISNIELYVLDPELQSVPANVIGELFIAGEGLARGYVNRPDLTAEKFLPNPFSAQPGQRMYQTGDLALLGTDDVIYYLGRTDSQVKIRGFRIELNEIDSHLLELPGVREAVTVVVGEESDKKLASYLVFHADGELTSTDEVKTALASRLPDYMVPSFISILVAIPLNANGKLDRKSLPAPTIPDDPARYLPPHGEREQALAEIWAQVLAIDVRKISRDHDFFALGGHSLSAAKLSANCQCQMGGELSLRDVFAAPTLAAQAKKLQFSEVVHERIAARQYDSAQAPLSFTQSRIWFLSEFQQQGAAYNVPIALHISGPLEPEVLVKNISNTVERHEILRTRYGSDGNEPFQIVDSAAELVVERRNLSSCDPQSIVRRRDKLIAEQAESRFNLAEQWPVRVMLIEESAEQFTLLLCFHHIAVDGVSVRLLLEEIALGYQRLRTSAFVEPPTRLQYRDFVYWQRDRIRGERWERLLGYWKEQLADLPPLLPLPTDRVRPPRQTVNGACLEVKLDHKLAARLKHVAREADASLFMVLVGAYKYLLSIYSGTHDIAVGIPVAGRSNPGLDSVVGFFANTVVLRTAVDQCVTFGDLLRQVKDATLGAHENQDMPFQRLVEELQPSRSLSYSPVFQVLFSLEHAQDLTRMFGSALGSSRLQVTKLMRPHTSAKFDLTLMLEEKERGVEGYFEFNTDLFEPTTIDRMRAHFLRILEAISSANRPAELRLHDIDYLSTEEKRQLLVVWNSGPDTTYQGSIADIFRENVQRHADQTAVVCGSEQLSYRELDARSSALAGHLQRAGVLPGEPVGLFVGPGVNAIAGVLAVIKCGGYYVPLDTNLPMAKLVQIVNAVNPGCILTECGSPTAGITASRVINLDDISYRDQSYDKPACDPRDLAYVMFTSGSTGIPKGVQISQRGILRLVIDPNFVTLNDRTVVLQAASLAFDAATFEVWGALLNGGRLIVHTDIALTADVLTDLIQRHSINTAWLTASLFNCLVDQNARCPAGLRYLLVGGDIVSPEHVARVHEQCPEIQIINGYGPTESTTFAACHRIARDSVTTARGTIPIGRPINNTQLHVLDARQQLVPIGVIGELYIGGDGLARGYLGEPELTSDKFVVCRLGSDASVRLYRSGDLVRRLPNGVLEFVGRADGQVKVRGFRIELAEIDGVLSRAPDVRSCTTIVADSSSGKQIVSYVTGEDVDTESIRLHLIQVLPSYMVPAFVVALDTLPLTRNGKLDINALPDFRGSIRADAADVPATVRELLLAEIWADLLGLSQNQLSRQSQFFELGGHSLLAARLVARVNTRQDTDISVRDVFESPVLAQLAAKLGNEVSAAPAIKRVSREGLHPLSYAQSRIWFLSQLEHGQGTYNVPLTLKLVSGDKLVVGDILAESVSEVVVRHEILRTCYRTVGGVPMQCIEADAHDFAVERVHWVDDDEEGIASFAAEYHARPFDLSAELPIRACVMCSPKEDTHWLLVCIHHIATDGWSMDLLMAELAACYNRKVESENNLPQSTLAIQYLDFTCWQRSWLRGERERRQIDYWSNQLAALPPKLDLPTDYPRPPKQSFVGRCYQSQLPERLLAPLSEVCRREGCTMYMLMLAGLKVLLSKYSGENDVAIGSPVANRPLAELEPLIGFFANTLVLRTQFDSNSTLRELVSDVKETTLAGYSNQDLPFEVLVELLQPERSLSYSPLFQVMFSLQHVTDSVPEFAGLSVQPLRQEHTQAKFDLSFMLHQSSDSISGYIEYSTALYEQVTIERMWRQYVHVLEQMATNLTLQLKDVRLEQDETVAQLYADINTATVEVPPQTLSQVFEQQVEHVPDSIAVRHAGDHLTYRELNSLANKAARKLVGKGAANHSACAVFLPRSMDLLIALLAIHKSGGFYVPMDPSYPAQRIADIMASAKPQILVTSSHLASTLKLDSDQSVLIMDDFRAGVSRDDFESNLDRVINLEQPAYAIYTSGSTGKPKGIAITHRNVAAMLAWAQQEYSQAQLADVLAATSICFDLSVYELFLPLSAGGCVHLVEDFLSLLEYPPDLNVSLVNTVPSAMEAVLQSGSLPPSVGTVNLAGEPLSRALVDKLYQLPQVDKVYNLYGPSEDTTYSTYALVPRESIQKPTIGRPIANTQAYVLDSELNQLPIGVAGELYLSGDGVSLGYIGRLDQTADCYLPNPFSSARGSRMYKTGDRVRIRSNGEFDYLGRVDHQVKVRGFRIELGEIESVLELHENVENVAVIVNSTINAQAAIVAFVTAKSSGSDGDTQSKCIEKFRQFLKDKLPDYMQPAYWQLVPKIPLLPNGKVDRKQLADRPLELNIVDDIAVFETATEQTLARIWAGLLGIERFCRRENFFTLGGHSLLATQLLSRVQDTFAVTLTIRDVFQHPTLEEQANLVDLLRTSAGLVLESNVGAEQPPQEEGAI